MSKKQTPKIEYRIANMKRVSYFENSIHDLGLSKDEIVTGNVALSLNMRLNEEKNLIILDTNVLFYHLKEQKNIDLFGIKTLHIFEVKNMTNVFSRDEKNKLIVPDDFLQTLLALTVGSIRGMAVVSVSNKEYTGIYLPVVNVKDVSKSIRRL